MSRRRKLAKELVARAGEAWSDAAVAAFAGEASVTTRNHVYRFRDGICCAIRHRDNDLSPVANAGDFVGMRMVGWFIDDGSPDGAHLAQVWQDGAHAILQREPRSQRESLALTSCTHEVRTGPHLAESAVNLRILPPELSRPSSGSMTRIYVVADPTTEGPGSNSAVRRVAVRR